MNAKEIRKEFHDLIWNGTEGTPEHINRLEALLEQFAIQVATEAVEETKKGTLGPEMMYKYGDKILKNIKKRLNA